MPRRPADNNGFTQCWNDVRRYLLEAGPSTYKDIRANIPAKHNEHRLKSVLRAGRFRGYITRVYSGTGSSRLTTYQWSAV